MQQFMPEYCDEQYNPARLNVPEFPGIMEEWAQRSAEARATLPSELNVAFGPSAGETLDFFPADGDERTLMVFIHGGYWTFADKNDFSFLAPAYVKNGINVACINYDLVPSVTLEELLDQCRQAIGFLYRNAEKFRVNPDKIYLSGHSAGGHIVAMLMATEWHRFSKGLPADIIKGGLSISGIHDLIPIMHAQFLNSVLQLNEERALALSPINLRPSTKTPLCTAVGANEKAEYLRQAQALNASWSANLKETLIVPNTNHFTILERLIDPSHALFKAACRLMS